MPEDENAIRRLLAERDAAIAAATATTAPGAVLHDLPPPLATRWKSPI